MAKGFYIKGDMIEIVYLALKEYSNKLYAGYLQDEERYRIGKLSKSDFDESVLQTLSDISVLENKIECNFSASTKRLLALSVKEIANKVILDLPCKVGDTVYFIDDKIVNGRKKSTISFVNKGIVDHITIGEIMRPILTVCDDSNQWVDFDSIEDIGIIAFLNEDDALKRLEYERAMLSE